LFFFSVFIGRVFFRSERSVQHSCFFPITKYYKTGGGYMITVILSFLLASAPLTVTEVVQVADKLVKEDFELLYVDQLLVDDTKLKLQMDILDEKLYEEPINAMLDENGKIIEGEPGRSLDRQKFQVLFLNYFYKGTPR